MQPSPDKMLQARLFSYPQAHRYRLGPNWEQLRINRPASDVANYQRDGLNANICGDGAPNYFPNSFNGPKPNETFLESIFERSSFFRKTN